MRTTAKPLSAMTAADLMSENLVMIPKEMSLEAAARMLCRHQLSGAPVVNDCGVCIGILSATDFVHWAERKSSPAKPGHGEADDVCRAWQIVEADRLPDDAVANYMTRNPVAVGPGEPIAELARTMIDAHIHRVIVVNEDDSPQGVVTSTDILAAIAYAEMCL